MNDTHSQSFPATPFHIHLNDPREESSASRQ